MTVGYHRSIFDGKKFFLKIIPFDAVFCADFEYHIHFAIKLRNNSESLYKTFIFAQKSWKTMDFGTVLTLFGHHSKVFFCIFFYHFVEKKKLYNISENHSGHSRYSWIEAKILKKLNDFFTQKMEVTDIVWAITHAQSLGNIQHKYTILIVFQGSIFWYAIRKKFVRFFCAKKLDSICIVFLHKTWVVGQALNSVGDSNYPSANPNSLKIWIWGFSTMLNKMRT